MEVITAGIGAMLSDPMCFVVLLFGALTGITFGCIPGLTATLGVALMIPITYTMTAHQGLTLLIAIYVGGISGGLRCLIEQPCLIPLFGLCQIHRPHHAFLGAFAAQDQ